MRDVSRHQVWAASLPSDSATVSVCHVSCYMLCNQVMQEAIREAEASNSEEVDFTCTRLVCRKADGVSL